MYEYDYTKELKDEIIDLSVCVILGLIKTKNDLLKEIDKRFTHRELLLLAMDDVLKLIN